MNFPSLVILASRPDFVDPMIADNFIPSTQLASFRLQRLAKSATADIKDTWQQNALGADPRA